MASVSGSSSTSNIYAALGIKNNGIGGLATGLDTDSLVAALTSGTRAKIAKQGQDKQLLNWKMTAYRSMTTALTAFQKKSFSHSNTTNTNIMSSGFFNTYKATSSSSKVSVATTADSVNANFTINKVNQIAEAESLSSKTKLSTDLLLDPSNLKAGDFTGETLKLDYNGTVKTIKLDSLNEAFNGDGTLDMGKLQEELQTLVDKAFSTKNVYTEVYNEETEKYDTVKTEAKNVTVSIADGKLKLDSDAGKVTIAADNYLFDVTAGDSSRVNLKTKIGAIDQFKDVQGNILKFNINGAEISVTKDDTLEALMAKINASDAGVRMSYSTYSDEFTLTSKTTGGGENIVIRDVQGNLMNKMFGAQSGNALGTGILTTTNTLVSQKTNQIDGLTTAEKKEFAKSFQHMAFEMTIDGVTKTVKLDSSKINSTENPSALKDGTYTMNDIYRALNKGIETTFGRTDVQFGMERDESGNPTGKTTLTAADGVGVSLNKGTSTMDVLGFSKPPSNSVLNLDYGNAIVASGALPTDATAADSINTLEMTINGVTKQLQIKGTITFGTFGNAEDKLNAAIESAFGKSVAENVNFSLTYGGAEPTPENLKLKLNINDSNLAVSIGHGSTQGGKADDLFEKLGFGDASTAPVNNYNADNDGTKLGDLASGKNLTDGTLTFKDMNGDDLFTIGYSQGTTLQDLINEINTKSNGTVTAEIKDGRLSVTSKSGEINVEEKVFKATVDGNGDPIVDGSGNPVGTYEAATDSGILKDVFGISGGAFKTEGQAYAEGAHKAGQNAEIVVDGTVISNASNTFLLNGVNVTVNEVTEPGEIAIKIDVKSDPEDVITRIKGWMDDYNALIYTLNSAINEPKNGDYFPLTDEQRSEMTEDQIKTWETEAKKGVLRNDSTLRDILAQLRQSLYEKVEAAGVSIFDLGITTKTYVDPNENGQIEFDKTGAGGEARLRALLETDPDKVRMFFTDANNGLAVKMNKIISNASNTSSVDRGSLVRIAGTDINTGDNTSILGNKISAIDKFVATLKSRMESEYSRYWKKFSALEVAVQRMSSQSSWLNQ